MVCQIDLMASFAEMLRQTIAPKEASDSENVLKALLGKSNIGRSVLVKQGGALSITKNDWKYIEPNNGQAVNTLTNIQLGNLPKPQLYNLKTDIGEQNNLADKHPQIVEELASYLKK